MSAEREPLLSRAPRGAPDSAGVSVWAAIPTECGADPPAPPRLLSLICAGRARAKRRGGIEEDLWPPPELESIDFLFLDEIGKEEPTDFSKRLLGKLIRSRCNAGLAIISTSNEDNGEALRSTLGDRIFFRLKERVWLKSISGANRRIGPSGERPF